MSPITEKHSGSRHQEASCRQYEIPQMPRLVSAFFRQGVNTSEVPDVEQAVMLQSDLHEATAHGDTVVTASILLGNTVSRPLLRALLCMTFPPREEGRNLDIVTSFSLNPDFRLPQFQLAYTDTSWGSLYINKCPYPDIVTKQSCSREIQFIPKRKQRSYTGLLKNGFSNLTVSYNWPRDPGPLFFSEWSVTSYGQLLGMLMGSR